MNEADRLRTIARYNERLSQFGVAPETLGWGGGHERQELRFGAAIEFVSFASEAPRSILDLGCGFGDFGRYLQVRFPEIEYLGIDINERLVDAGRKTHGIDLRVGAIENVPDKSFDLVVANGVFNFRSENETHEDYVVRSIEHFCRVARIGIAVDFMSTYVDFNHPGAFHCPEQLIIDAVKRHTRRYIIRNDYLDYEFMIYGLFQGDSQ